MWESKKTFSGFPKMKPCARRHRAASGDCSARGALDTRSRERPQPAARCGTSGTSGTVPKLRARGSPQDKRCRARDSRSRRRRSGCRSQPRERRLVPLEPARPRRRGQLPAAIPSVRRSPPVTGGAGAVRAGQLRGAEVKVCKVASLGTGAGLSHRRNTARSAERRTKPGAAPAAGPSTYHCAKQSSPQAAFLPLVRGRCGAREDFRRA